MSGCWRRRAVFIGRRSTRAVCILYGAVCQWDCDAADARLLQLGTPAWAFIRPHLLRPAATSPKVDFSACWRCCWRHGEYSSSFYVLHHSDVASSSWSSVQSLPVLEHRARRCIQFKSNTHLTYDQTVSCNTSTKLRLGCFNDINSINNVLLISKVTADGRLVAIAYVEPAHCRLLFFFFLLFFNVCVCYLWASAWNKRLMMMMMMMMMMTCTGHRLHRPHTSLRMRRHYSNYFLSKILYHRRS